MLPNFRNPRYVPRLNPNINLRINPRFNSALNPVLNSTINPRFNSTINPRFNATINPRFNSRLNYRFNNRINPRFNPRLNPHFNVLFNPNRAIRFLLPVIFDLNIAWNQFAIPLPEDFDGYIVYNTNLELQCFVFSNNAGGYNLFNIDNEWIGYWIPMEVGFLEFDIMGNWERFVIV